MAATRINVVFEGPEMQDGVPLHDLNETLKRVQDAVRLMTAHLAGVEVRGRPPQWLRDQSSLRLMEVFPGSFGAALALAPSRDVSAGVDFGAAALDAILNWPGDNWSLPREVTDCLNAIGFNLSPQVNQVRLDDPTDGRRVEIRRTRRERRLAPRAPDFATETEISLRGRLLEVNWSLGTAELHNYGESPTSLQFAAELSAKFQELATRYVTVKGIGRVNFNDEWETVTVREIIPEWSVRDDFYSREPEAFNPEQATAFYRQDDDDAVNVEEFIRNIYEARDT